MAWSIVLSTFIWIVLNIPFLYAFVSVHKKDTFLVYSISPHLTIFMPFVFPFITFISITIFLNIINKVNNIEDVESLPWFLYFFKVHWISIIIIGFVISGIISMIDYFGNPKSVDKYKYEYALQISNIARKIVEGGIPKKQCKIKNKYKNKDSNIICSLLDAGTQHKNGYLHPIVHLTNQIQAMIFMFVGFLSVILLAIISIARVSGVMSFEDEVFSLLLVFSLWAIYPIMYGYWAGEVYIFTGKPFGNLSHILVAIPIFISVLVLLTFSKESSFSRAVTFIMPLFSLLSFFFNKHSQYISFLRRVIGMDANIATMSFVIMGLIVAGLFASIIAIVKLKI